MPYKSISDINEGVRGVLPISALKVFLKAFNSSWNSGWGEAKCFRNAWTAVKNDGYSKNDVTGKWEK